MIKIQQVKNTTYQIHLSSAMLYSQYQEHKTKEITTVVKVYIVN